MNAATYPTPRRAERAQRKEPCHVDSHCPRSRPRVVGVVPSLLRALNTRRISSVEGRVFALVSAARGPNVATHRPPALFSSED